MGKITPGKHKVSFVDLPRVSDLFKTEEIMEKKTDLKLMEAIMRWKLGFGNFNDLLEGRRPLPAKRKKAVHMDFLQPMPRKGVSHLVMSLLVSKENMDTLRLGHIPDAQEDHWFMYCDDKYIRFYRSWTGTCIFRAHYCRQTDSKYLIDRLTVNHALAEFGVCSDMPAARLFVYLLVAGTDGNSEAAWDDFINSWECWLRHSKCKE